MLCAASVDVTMRSLWIQPTTTTTVNDVIMIIQHWWEIILVWSYNSIMIIIIVQYLASIQNVCWKRCCFVYLVVDVFFFRFVSTDVEQCITTGFFSYSSYIIYIFFWHPLYIACCCYSGRQWWRRTWHVAWPGPMWPDRLPIRVSLLLSCQMRYGPTRIHEFPDEYSIYDTPKGKKNYVWKKHKNIGRRFHIWD